MSFTSRNIYDVNSWALISQKKHSFKRSTVNWDNWGLQSEQGLLILEKFKALNLEIDDRKQGNFENLKH